MTVEAVVIEGGEAILTAGLAPGLLEVVVGAGEGNFNTYTFLYLTLTTMYWYCWLLAFISIIVEFEDMKYVFTIEYVYM